MVDASVTNAIGIGALGNDRKALSKDSVLQPLGGFLARVKNLSRDGFEEVRWWEFGGCSTDQLLQFRSDGRQEVRSASDGSGMVDTKLSSNIFID